MAPLIEPVNQTNGNGKWRDHMNGNPTKFLDRHGALTILFAVVLNTAAMVGAGSWWAASIQSDVRSLQSDADKREELVAMIAETIRKQSERLARVETTEANTVKILEQITQMRR